MQKPILTSILTVILAGSVSAARADVWDLGADTDNDSGTDNEIVHGLEQVHDLAAQNLGTQEDVDWYRFHMPYATSWEIVLDGLTGDLSSAAGEPALEEIGSDGTTVDITGSPLTSFGVAQHLTDFNIGVYPDAPLFVRVSGPACGLLCGPSDQYRIRAQETTLFVPRYNNVGGQVTILVLQNDGSDTVSGWVYAFGVGGAFPGYFSFTLMPYEAATYNLATVAAGVLNNTSGGLRIMHTAAAGLLTGKAVALEPTTGFTFDTAVLPRPR
jgi:hypothetical protein